MRSPSPSLLLLPALALTLAACLHGGAAAGHWRDGNRAVQGYTDSQGNHYPWLPYQPLDFYSSEDGDVSNQISGHHAVVPHSNSNSHSRYSGGGWRWRHRAGRHRKVVGGGSAEGSGSGGRGGRRRGKVTPAPIPAASLNAAPAVASPRAVMRTTQRGWAYVPHRGATVDVPRRTASSKVYRGTITTSVVPPESGALTQGGAGRGGGTLVRAAGPAPAPAPEGPVRDAPAAEVESSTAEAEVCVRCPGDVVLVASRGRRMVTLDQPQLRPCPHGKNPRVEHLNVEWREGPRPGALVAEGVHAMVGEVSYRGRHIRTCRFNVFVVVRECTPLSVGAGVRAQCSAGAAWGSRCSFSCSDGRRPLGARNTLCTDALRWTHSPPLCPPPTDEATASAEQAAGAAGAVGPGRGCPSPLGPHHGRLLCQAPLDSIPAASQEPLLPERTQCEFVCEEGFALAHAHRHLALIECRNGAWNTSADPQCLSITGEHQHPNAIQRDVGAKQHKQHKQRRRHKEARLKSLGDPCRPNPCQGGGTCLRSPAAAPASAPALCLCPEHRQGELCEFARCTERCENGGKCVVVDEKAICFCPARYSGQHCEIPDSR